MSNSYHILWIGDEWEEMTSFQKYCKLHYNMELTPFKTQKEGLDTYAKNPTFWEAVILDAKVLNESEQEVPSVTGLRDAVLRIKEEFKELPYFISTGQPDLLSDNMFKSISLNSMKKKLMTRSFAMTSSKQSTSSPTEPSRTNILKYSPGWKGLSQMKF